MNSFKVLYIGRKNSGSRTGIGASAKMITNLLENSNCIVTFIDSRDYNAYLKIKYDVDVVWFYDDTEYDAKNIQTLQNLYNNNVPILINSTYNDTEGRTNIIIDKYKLFNNNNFNNVYFVVFSKEIENNFNLKDYKNNIVSLPKTIKIERNKIPPYNKRKNICLGEYNKFMNSALTDNLNVYKLIYELKNEFKDITLIAVKHYDYDINHALHPHRVNKINNKEEISYIENNVNTIGYREDLLHWIKDFRVYLSLINKESFSMIPAEAQSVGTFVMYRNMPQSLNSYFYYSAYMWDNIDDLKNAIHSIYYNEKVWNELSELSILNYQTNCINKLKYMLRLELEKIVIRHRNINLNKK